MYVTWVMMITMKMVGMVNKEMKIYNGNIFKTLTVAHQNIPGVLSSMNKETSIEELLSQKRPHVLALSEPRWSELSTFTFDGYNLIKGIQIGVKDPRMNVLVKDGVDYTQINLRSQLPTVHLRIGGQHLVFTYREWRKSGVKDTGDWSLQEERWESFVQQWKKIRGRVILMGDINIEYWRSVSRHHQECAGMKDYLMENIISSGYVQLITDYTREQGTSRSCLDHLYSNCPQFIHQDSVMNTNVLGYDHHYISCRISLLKPAFSQKVIEVRNLKKLSKEEFKEMWDSMDHSDFWKQSNVNEAVELYVHKVQCCLNELAPLRKIVVKSTTAPYLTPELLEQIKIRKELWRKSAISGLQEDRDEFKRFRNSLRYRLNRAKKDFINSSLEEEDPKKSWAVIQKLSGLSVKKTDKILLKEDERMLEKPSDVADRLNSYFVEKVETIVAEHPPDPVKASQYTDRYLKEKKTDILQSQYHIVGLLESDQVGVVSATELQSILENRHYECLRYHLHLLLL